MTTKTKTVSERLKLLEAIGRVKSKPALVGRTTSYVVSDAQFEIAKEGFFALMERYGVSSGDMLLVKEAVAYMYFWTHSQNLAKSDVMIEDLASKIKWQ